MAEPIPIRKRRRVPGTPLTEMQLAILTLYSAGFSRKQIARHLNTTPKMISTSAHTAARNLGARSLVHAVVLADRAGYLPGRQLALTTEGAGA